MKNRGREPMKIKLFYYSATGNTKLVCEYMQKKIPEMELHDITETPVNQIGIADVVGIAMPVFYLKPPPVVSAFIDSINCTDCKPSFILATYGMMQGKTISTSGKKLSDKKLNVFNYHSFRMPESFPPYIKKGWAADDAPNNKEIVALDSFIESVKIEIKKIMTGQTPAKATLKDGLFNALIPAPSYVSNMKKFGFLTVDNKLCNSCGICKNGCNYHAVSIERTPSFDRKKCHACFKCFNRCPQGAISTSKFSSKHKYSGPDKNLQEKFL
jgi:ferredoxin